MSSAVRTRRAVVGLIVGMAASLAGASASAQSFPSPSLASAAAPPLNVPFLAQSPLLCGGAAIAMVERWWGRRGVQAEDFQALVRPEEFGIRTTELADAARARGWQVRTQDGSAAVVRATLAAGIPVVALIEVGRNRYHFVVVLQWDDGRVIYHDPARGPDRRASAADFTARWQKADRWMLVMEPAEPAPPGRAVPPVEAPALPPLADEACGAVLRAAQAAAAADSLEQAASLLLAALPDCPSAAVLRRELAGVRFRQRRLDEAIASVQQYLRDVPADTLGWELLAASRYLRKEPGAALDAWNRIGRPVVDHVEIDGVGRTPYRLLLGIMQLPTGRALTRNAMALAERRLRAVPAVAAARVAYAPLAGGMSEVRASVLEHPVLPRAPLLLAREGVGALLQQEVRADAANLLQLGERWRGAYSWQSARALAGAWVDLPLAAPLPFVAGFMIGWDRYRLNASDGAAPVAESSRRVAGVRAAVWLTPFLQTSLGIHNERWTPTQRYLAGDLAVAVRSRDDRAEVDLQLIRGTARSAATPSYLRGALEMRWRSAFGIARRTLGVRAGVDFADRVTPAGLWSVTGGRYGYMIPLRGRTGIAGEGIAASAVTRALVHGGLTADAPLHRFGPFVIAGGVFVDAAQALTRPDALAGRRTRLDAGGGLRLGVAGLDAGVLRVDLGTGLLDRSTALTAGLQASWPFASRTR